MPINKSLLNNKQMSTQLTPQEKLLYGIQRKPIINNIPQSINTSPVIQNASFSLLPIDNQSRPLKQPLGNLNINQLVPEEQKPSTQDDSNFLASLIGQSAAMLGAGIRGGNLSYVAENFQEMRDRRERQKEQEDLAKKYTDPNSEESKKRRLVYKSALGIDIPENYSYTDLNDPIVLQSIKDKSAEMKYAQMPKQVGTVPTGAKTEKEKKNPFLKETTEINIRSKNTLDALDKIENIISNYGTAELTGPQEKQLEQYINNVAQNYNKILDPTSVVREGEARQVADSLGIGGYGRYLTSKDTALKQIKSFRDLVINSRDNALNEYSQKEKIDFTKVQ